MVAAIDDGDAFRPIGVPDTVMDSAADKTFAFDYFNTLPAGNFPVLGRKRLGEPVEALNPDDGTAMQVSSTNLSPGTFFTGNFLTIRGGISVGAQGDVLVDATFLFDDDSTKRGLFVASGPGAVRNVVFEGYAAPGFSGTSFTTARGARLADNGNVMFAATLFTAPQTGPGVTTATDEFLWVEDDGDFKIVLQEGTEAPGLPGKLVNATTVNLLILAVEGERALFFGGAAQPGGTVRRTLWLGDTSGDSLAPIIQATASPVLTDADYFTDTNQGAIAFTSVDTNAVLLDDSGRVTLVAAGEFADGSRLGGLWRRGAGAASWELLVAAGPAMANLRLLSANNLGGTAFLAENAGVETVWTRSPLGTLSSLMAVGDLVEGQPVTGFADHATFSGLAGEAAKTLGAPAKLTQLNDQGDLVFVARFADTDADDDSRSDEAIMLAAFVPPPTDRFLWNDEGGDGNWHTLPNWEDFDSGAPATRTPGDAPGTEDATIPAAGVLIDDRAVQLLHLSADGALTVQQPLSLMDDSLITNLELDAALDFATTLQLEGASRWLSGDIVGSADGATLALGGALELSGRVRGRQRHEGAPGRTRRRRDHQPPGRRHARYQRGGAHHPRWGTLHPRGRRCHHFERLPADLGHRQSRTVRGGGRLRRAAQ